MTLTSTETQAVFARDLSLIRDQPQERGLIHQAVYRWYEIFHQATGIEAFDRNASRSIMLPSGEALDTVGAAFCLLEAQRTAVFLRGIENAVRDLQQHFPGERIRVLYAGCGPYATLLTPLSARFSPEELGWHLLDVNATSLEAARTLHHALGIDRYLLGAELADAAEISLSSREPFHLVISETMQRALQNETQLAIMLHLIPQMQLGALFIPERISVHAALQRWTESTGGVPEPVFERLQTIYEVRQTQVVPPAEVFVDVPELAAPAALVLTTEVQVYKAEVLAGNDASITLPKVMRRELPGGERLVFRYHWDPHPGFVCNTA